MTTLGIIAAAFVGLLGGIAGGLALGGLVRGRARWYWALNGGVAVACMAADFAGLVLGWPWLAYGALGAMGGALTGLRYGYSDGAGVWRATTEPAADAGPDDADEPEAHDGPAAG